MYGFHSNRIVVSQKKIKVSQLATAHIFFSTSGGHL